MKYRRRPAIVWLSKSLPFMGETFRPGQFSRCYVIIEFRNEVIDKKRRSPKLFFRNCTDASEARSTPQLAQLCDPVLKGKNGL